MITYIFNVQIFFLYNGYIGFNSIAGGSASVQTTLSLWPYFTWIRVAKQGRCCSNTNAYSALSYPATHFIHFTQPEDQ